MSHLPPLTGWPSQTNLVQDPDIQSLKQRLHPRKEKEQKLRKK